ncbi:Mob protein [Paracoccus sp. PARArs4]|uniref:Mob protein n=1 Tax=Paracoccus sp. PARArs4 TaxID=2853442 RepID=UPI0024A646D9|nr:Mob protein [Paracoccus sp. PARArs4]
MSYQFVHIECYSAKPRQAMRGSDHFNSAEQVFAEAAREARYSAHVPSPRPAQQFAGTRSVEELRALWRSLTANTKVMQPSGKGDNKLHSQRLRSNANTLYTEIHSHPARVEDIWGGKSPELKQEVEAWIDRAVSHFEKRMPPGVEYAVALHTDEAHVHFHILALNVGDPKLNANKLHAGKAAAERVRESEEATTPTPGLPRPELEPRPRKPKKFKPSKNRKTQARNEVAYREKIAAWEAECVACEARNDALLADWRERNKAHQQEHRRTRGRTAENKAYNAALRALQDDYHAQVGAPSGLLRDGPRKARKTTRQHAAEKETAKRLAKVMQSQKSDHETNLRFAQQNADDEAANAQTRAALEAWELDLARTEARLIAGNRALRDQKALHAREAEAREAALRAREEAVSASEQDLQNAFEGLNAIMTGLEDGSVTVADNRITGRGLGSQLRSAFAADAPRTPGHSLLRRFVRFVIRSWNAIETRGGPEIEHDYRDGPSM